MTDAAPAIEPIAITAADAAAAFGVTRTTWERWHEQGRVPGPVQIGKARLWVVGTLRAWAQAGCPPRRRFELLQQVAQEHAV